MLKTKGGKIMKDLLFKNESVNLKENNKNARAYTCDDNVSASFKDISKYPLLTKEEEIELAKKIAAGDKSAKEKFFNSNRRLVADIAKKYLGNGVEFPDLVQEGNIGLLRAIEKFDYKKGNKFSTYATYWIKNRISEKVRKERNRIEVTSLDALVYDDDGISQMDKISNNGFTYYDEVAEEVERSETKRRVKELLTILNEREQYVIKHKYGVCDECELTLKQIGINLDITPQRVHQIEKGALKKLRNYLTDPEMAKKLTGQENSILYMIETIVENAA